MSCLLVIRGSGPLSSYPVISGSQEGKMEQGGEESSAYQRQPLLTSVRDRDREPREQDGRPQEKLGIPRDRQLVQLSKRGHL